MTHSVTLATYSIQLVKLGSSDGGEVLSALPGGLDYLQKLDEWTEELRSVPRNDDERSAQLRVSRKGSIGARTRYFVVSSGHYGYSAELRDVTTDKVSFKKSVNDVVLVPFVVAVHVPSKARRGILVVQRLSQLSPYTDLNRYWTEQTSQLFADVRLNTARCASKAVVEAALNGGVKAIEVEMYRDPEESSVALGLLKNPSDVHRAQIRLLPKRGQTFSLSRDLRTVARSSDFSALSIHGFDTESARVRLEIRQEDGRVRKVEMGRIEELVPYLDVTDEIQKWNEGHPDTKEVVSLCTDAINELASDLGIDGVS